MQLRQANTREQGDVAERLAAAWLLQAGYHVWVPFGHSPHTDLVADDGEDLCRVQVKTSTYFRKGRWCVTLCTRGGNQSWSGRVKTLDPALYDYLFVLVGDRRMWLIPSDHVRGGSAL